VAVQIAAVDVSDETQLSAFLDRYRSEGWPPIRGIIHTAAVLKNGLAATMDRATFDVPMRAKLRAAQLLDRLVPDLDLFVLFSSIPGFLAHSGVANYAAANAGLDALAQDRRARGLPGLSIAWGVWQDTGLVKDQVPKNIIAEFKRQGIETLSADRGTRIFIWACGLADPSVAVLPVDWAAFHKARPGRQYPMLSGLVAGARGQAISPTSIHSQLSSASLAERRKLLDGITRDVIARVLNLPPSRVDARKAFGAMGLTSLMAMELRNRLEAALDRPISATLAWNYPTLEALVDHLAKEPGEESDTSVPTSLDVPFEVADHLIAIEKLSDEEAVAALRR
jgi:myxalamid-type polyketide synthase MxaE and MxaD